MQHHIFLKILGLALILSAGELFTVTIILTDAPMYLASRDLILYESNKMFECMNQTTTNLRFFFTIRWNIKKIVHVWYF